MRRDRCLKHCLEALLPWHCESILHVRTDALTQKLLLTLNCFSYVGNAHEAEART